MSYGVTAYGGTNMPQTQMQRHPMYQSHQNQQFFPQQMQPNQYGANQNYSFQQGAGRQMNHYQPPQRHSFVPQKHSPNYPMNNPQMYNGDCNANANSIQHQQGVRWQMPPQNTGYNGYIANQNVYQTSPNLSPVSTPVPGNATHSGLPYQQPRRRMSSSSQQSDYSTSSGVSSNRNDQSWPSRGLNPTPPLALNQAPRYITPAGQEGDKTVPSQISPNPMPPGYGQQWDDNRGKARSATVSPILTNGNSPQNNYQQPMRPFDAVQFRQPRPPPLMAGVPLAQLPPSGYLGHIPGAVAGTKGNDWEVECLQATVKLRNHELWRHFDNVVMEMVISKHGRRMFPVLEYDIVGLHPQKLYSVFVDFVLCSNYVWKFVEQKWQASGLAPLDEDAFERNHRICVHPDSPASGDVWNKRGVTFSKMKLSNHLHSDGDKLSLKSLHKYQPRLHVVEVNPRDPTIQSNLRTFIIPKTAFMTVTLYHNTDVAQLKINLNPFARCFRDKEVSERSPSAGSPSDIKGTSPYEISQYSSSPSPTNDMVKYEANGTNIDGAVIYKVTNPVPDDKLNKAKDFMQAQLKTMSQLVHCQNFHSQNTPPTTNQPVAIRFNKELEDLLSNVENDTIPGSNDPGNIDELKQLLSDNTENATSGNSATVHHKPLNGVEEPFKQTTTKIVEITADSKETYELSQVDRVFPPNAVAPVSTKLPFTAEQIKESADRATKRGSPLPVFFDCQFYREQAAQAQMSKTEDKNGDVPTVYIPSTDSTITCTNNTNDAENTIVPNTESLHKYEPVTVREIHESTSNEVEINTNPLSPISRTLSGENFTNNDENQDDKYSETNYLSFPLPDLSPSALNDFLGTEDAPNGNKRKFSYDDDDDVFTTISNELPMHDYLATVNKRQCIAANGML